MEACETVGVYGRHGNALARDVLTCHCYLDHKLEELTVRADKLLAANNPLGMPLAWALRWSDGDRTGTRYACMLLAWFTLAHLQRKIADSPVMRLAEHLRRQPHALSLDIVLRSLEHHCTVPDIAEHLGCNVTSVRRHLNRAELAELATCTLVNGIGVWELTPSGVARLRLRNDRACTRASDTLP